MLSKYQLGALRFLVSCYKFMYEVPVKWKETSNQIVIIPEKRKWRMWYIGIGNVFLLWFTCVYTLGTQPFLHRKSFKVLHFCILTTGFCCFAMTLSVAKGILSLKKYELYVKSLNELNNLEYRLYKKYQPTLLDPKQKPNLVDFVFLIVQAMNIVPYLITLICIYWDLDGPYWVLEDIAGDPKYRSLSSILLLLGIRFLLLAPGFLETTRTLIGSGLLVLTGIYRLYTILRILKRKVGIGKGFFYWYNQLYVLCNIFSYPILQTLFLAISVYYFLFIQTLWICICGCGRLEHVVYLFFAMYATAIIVSICSALPLMTVTGEAVKDLPEIKRREAAHRNNAKKILSTNIYLKRAIAIQPIQFSYGGYYPLGKNFVRNTFENAVQNLLSLVLVFDVTGRRKV